MSIDWLGTLTLGRLELGPKPMLPFRRVNHKLFCIFAIVAKQFKMLHFFVKFDLTLENCQILNHVVLGRPPPSAGSAREFPAHYVLEGEDHCGNRARVTAKTAPRPVKKTFPLLTERELTGGVESPGWRVHRVFMYVLMVLCASIRHGRGDGG